MSNEDSDEIPITIEGDENDVETTTEQSESVDVNSQEEPVGEKSDSINEKPESVDELKSLLAEERQKVVDYENKLKYVLADFQNLEKKTQSDIENGVQTGIDKFILDFLPIYEDFVRAKSSYEKSNIDTKGLDSILKNMDSLLKKYNIVPIEALGEVFDPNLHDAISVKVDSSLDEGTITQEIRKGYISHNRVIRPTLVEISKKS